ncbi:hypothetical protein [Comamonas testosteroni]|uniref:hypothetical protein n=1 Tax=Comamonas testosteroni TaxID=285 RepID=UPI00391B6A8F
MSPYILYPLSFLFALLLVAGVWKIRPLRWLLAFVMLISFLARFDWFKNAIKPLFGS